MSELTVVGAPVSSDPSGVHPPLPPVADAAPDWTHTWRLACLHDQEFGRLRGVRFARALSLSVVVSTVALMLFVNGLTGDASVAAVALRGVGILSWGVGGLGAWSAARNLQTASASVTALSRLRGVSTARALRLVSLGAALRVTRLVALPSGLLGLLAVSVATDLASGVARLLFLFGVLFYSALLSLFLILSSHLCARLVPRRAGLLLAALVLGPHLARLWQPDTPSVPALFGWLLERVGDLGMLA